MQVVGTERFIAATLGRAGREFAEGIRGLRLPLSASKTHYVASSSRLEALLQSEWTAYSFESRDTCRNLGTNATAGRRRRVPVARTRRKGASARTKRLLSLRAAGAHLGPVQRSGPTAAGLWGGAVTGLTDAQLHGLRVSSLRSAGRLPKGSSLGLRIQATKATRLFDPFRIHEGLVIKRWAEAVWEGYPSAAILKASLEGAKKRLARASCKWGVASDPIVVLLLTHSDRLRT